MKVIVSPVLARSFSGYTGCDGGIEDYAFNYMMASKGMDTLASYPYIAGVSIQDLARQQAYRWAFQSLSGSRDGIKHNLFVVSTLCILLFFVCLLNNLLPNKFDFT